MLIGDEYCPEPEPEFCQDEPWDCDGKPIVQCGTDPNSNWVSYAIIHT